MLTTWDFQEFKIWYQHGLSSSFPRSWSQCRESSYRGFSSSSLPEHFQCIGRLLYSTCKLINRSLLFFVNFHRLLSASFHTHTHPPNGQRLINWKFAVYLWWLLFLGVCNAILKHNITGAAFLVAVPAGKSSWSQTLIFGKSECQKPGYEAMGPFIGCSDT